MIQGKKDYDMVQTPVVKEHLKTSVREFHYTEESEEPEVKEIKYLAGSEGEFFMIYASLISMIEVNLSLPEIKVYCYLLRSHKMGTSIALNKTVKQEIADAHNIKSGTVNNALGELVKKKLIYRIGTGTYKLNPRFAFKGNSVDRKKMLKFVLEHECPDC